MTSLRRSGMAVFAAALVPGSVWAQRGDMVPAVPPGGTVTGVVTCADTQRPARFAEVRLIRKLTVEQAKLANLTLGDEMPKGVDPAAGRATGSAETVTGLDGSFRVESLQAGDYFVLAATPGYLTPLNPLQPLEEHKAAPEQSRASNVDQNKLLERLPLVHVVAGGGAAVNVSLQRAAALSGTVRYEDGSPAIGIRVAAHAVNGAAEEDSPIVFAVPRGLYTPTWQTTDDEGYYRLSGLPAGKYRVRATLVVEKHVQETVAKDSVAGVSEGLQQLQVYAPGTQLANEAAVVELKGGEPVRGVDLTLDLNGLHTVRGRLIAAGDHHGIASAEVRLEQGDGKDFGREVAINFDGSFRLDYLPAGTYSLTIDDIRDLARPGPDGEEGKVLRRYGKIVKTVIVEEADTDLGELETVAATGGEAREKEGARDR